jgi:cytochrome c oxidase assembly protein subunit 15
VRGRIPAGYKPRLFALLALIGLQGTLGWLMVHSGLQKGMTEVAPLWLATHLITALFTLPGWCGRRWICWRSRKIPAPSPPG